jgi:hypothetical protein
MTDQKSFGHRAHPPRPPLAVKARAAALPADQPAAVAPAPTSSLDRELAEWKKARWRNFKLPWWQLYFLASLFFGIASLALPDSVNDEVDWLLYALMAASLYAGFAARRRKANA